MKAKYQKINQEVEVSNKVEAVAVKTGSFIGSVLNGLIRGSVSVVGGVASGVNSSTPDINWTGIRNTINTVDLNVVDGITVLRAEREQHRATYNMNTGDSIVAVKNITAKLVEFNEVAKAYKNIHEYDARTQKRIIADYNQLKKELNS